MIHTDGAPTIAMRASEPATCRCSALREVPARLCPAHGEAAQLEANRDHGDETSYDPKASE